MAVSLSLNDVRLNAIVLLLLLRAPSRTMSEAELIELAKRSTWLTHEERLSVPSRVDSRIANRIHNLVSHRDSRKNSIRLKLVGWDSSLSAFHATERGIGFLRKLSSKLGADGQDDFRVIERWLSKLGANSSDENT